MQGVHRRERPHNWLAIISGRSNDDRLPSFVDSRPVLAIGIIEPAKRAHSTDPRRQDDHDVEKRIEDAHADGTGSRHQHASG